MFASIASRYDIANDILSMGLHRLWKMHAIRWAEFKTSGKFLDACTGTGDLAVILMKEKSREVIATDFTPEMLACARSGPKYLVADTLALPFEEKTFQGITIAFGIRNVDDPLKGLQELYRVLAPEGKILVLEFGQPPAGIWNSLYKFYSKYILPKLGAVLTGRPEAYEYLPETSWAFPCREEFLALMKQAGFSDVRYRSYGGGIAYGYVGGRD
jgi:demethylmenaquinone methyltransferase / 2-methoxy-6-polyprenyl-1,4-benzoquinol methylase